MVPYDLEWYCCRQIPVLGTLACTLIFVPGPPHEEQPMRTEALGVGRLQLPGSLGDSWM